MTNEHRDKVKAQVEAYRIANPEKVKAAAAWYRNRPKANEATQLVIKKRPVAMTAPKPEPMVKTTVKKVYKAREVSDGVYRLEMMGHQVVAYFVDDVLTLRVVDPAT